MAVGSKWAPTWVFPVTGDPKIFPKNPRDASLPPIIFPDANILDNVTRLPVALILPVAITALPAEPPIYKLPWLMLIPPLVNLTAPDIVEVAGNALPNTVCPPCPIPIVCAVSLNT